MGKTCAICGKPSGMYPLCKDCFKLKDEGKVVKCEECGTWYLADEGCPNCKPEEKVPKTKKSSPPKRKVVKCEECGTWYLANEGCPNCKPVKTELQEATPNAEELTCIVCGKPSNGKHFCINCYHKCKNKSILLKIDKCQFPAITLDESYEGVFPCLDGHIVKSMAEQTIDNYLCRHAIFHGYELPLAIGIGREPLKPDFCLKNYLGEGKDVYIEYFGMEGDPEYDKKTAYKMPIYREKGITLICLYRKEDGHNLEFALDQKLDKDNIEEGKIHYEKNNKKAPQP